MEPINKAALASVQKVDAGNPAPADGAKGPKNSSFKDVMADKAGATDEAKQAQGTQGPEKAQQVDKTSKAEMTRKVDTFVKGISSDQKRIDRMMNRLSRGGDVSNTELLRMQAVTYRYAQRVDLATKVVEKTAGGLKQVMNTQV